jgi:hypothetical protein
MQPASSQHMQLQGNSPWVVDSGASTHMTSSDGMLTQRLPPSISSITVGNGTSIPVTSRGHSILPTPATNFALNNIMVAPSIVRNMLSVRQFTRDNSCSFEFDAHGFSTKDLRTGRVILRCNCDGDLYTMPTSTPGAPPHALLAASSTLWHQRLDHPAPAALERLNNLHVVSCNKVDHSLCHSCQIGKHTRLPFSSSHSITHLLNLFTVMYGLPPSIVCLVFHTTWSVWMISLTTVEFFRSGKNLMSTNT